MTSSNRQCVSSRAKIQLVLRYIWDSKKNLSYKLVCYLTAKYSGSKGVSLYSVWWMVFFMKFIKRPWWSHAAIILWEMETLIGCIKSKLAHLIGTKTDLIMHLFCMIASYVISHYISNKQCPIKLQSRAQFSAWTPFCTQYDMWYILYALAITLQPFFLIQRCTYTKIW